MCLYDLWKYKLFTRAINSSYELISPRLSSSQYDMLKIIAVLAMVVSHVGMFALSEYSNISFEIGRVAMPLFSFLLMYGYIHYTSSPLKYLVRIFIVALVSQAPASQLFDIEGYIMSLNIMFTLFFGLLIVYLLDYGINSKEKKYTYFSFYLAAILFMASGIFVDYFYLGLILIISYWSWLRFSSHQTLYAAMIATSLLNIPYGIFVSVWGMGALVILYLVMNTKFKFPRINKWFFYLFYPVHLVILNIIF